jgi:hypothetical protein
LAIQGIWKSTLIKIWQIMARKEKNRKMDESINLFKFPHNYLFNLFDLIFEENEQIL